LRRSAEPPLPRIEDGGQHHFILETAVEINREPHEPRENRAKTSSCSRILRISRFHVPFQVLSSNRQLRLGASTRKLSVSQIANRKSTGGFKRLQRIQHEPGANDDLVCGAHKTGWPRKGGDEGIASLKAKFPARR
jgi:hypothetical protein